jgi:hypothetical protein
MNHARRTDENRRIAMTDPDAVSSTDDHEDDESSYELVARLARVLLASGREDYQSDAIAEAFRKLPLDDLPAHPTKADFRAATRLLDQ